MGGKDDGVEMDEKIEKEDEKPERFEIRENFSYNSIRR